MTIEVVTESGPRPQAVDLVETFNWLYGLAVHQQETWTNDDDPVALGDEKKQARRYRIVKARDRDGRNRVLVVWRDMTDLDPKVERQFLEAKLKDVGPFEEMWINGDTATPELRSLDALFKRLMEEGER